MKIYNKIFIFFAAAASFAACVDQPEVEFDVDTSEIAVGPEGGVKTVKVSASEKWVASTQQPWITVSPANGVGTTECSIIIDSTLNWNDKRVGTVYINPENSESRKFTITQNGFGYQITVDKSEVSVQDYAEYGKRTFEVKVKSNVDFNVEVPASAINWLKFKKSKLELDRQARPRTSVVKFEWQINSMPQERIAEVKFVPVETVEMGRQDNLKVVQQAAFPIPEGTVEGDSLALLAINRSLGVWTEFDTSERIENWNGVTVWKTKDDRNGRVRSASFAAFTTKEGLPYEVQYLTAAEELSFYGNTNTHLLDLDCGPYICELTQLRKLTIGAYGLVSLHSDFKNLSNLEYLNLESNNFQTVPKIICEENFPKLTALILNANTRYVVMDLSNDVRDNVGGFVDEEKFPVRFLTWNKLDTLRFSANHLQGSLPSDEEMMALVQDRWTTAELKDSIAVGSTFFDDNVVPKVLPETDFLAINLNRLYGKLPKWILYHPKLDLWYPDLLIWSQEGTAADGTKSGFSNAPTNMNYYYDNLYVNKKYNPKNYEEESYE